MAGGDAYKMPSEGGILREQRRHSLPMIWQGPYNNLVFHWQSEEGLAIADAGGSSKYADTREEGPN